MGQGMDACKILSDIPTWMGSTAKYTVHALSLDEANVLVCGWKRLEKENLWKAHLKLLTKLSALHLGQTGGGLSATARPFVPLAASSATAVRSLITKGLLAPDGNMGVTRPLYTSDDNGITTDGTSFSKKQPQKKRGKQQGKHKGVVTTDAGVSDNGSEGSSISVALSKGCWKKKCGVNAKVQIPEFGGKASNPIDYASAFSWWASAVSYYIEYYEDQYIMSSVIATCKDNAADVFNFAHATNPNGDLGVVLADMRNHYCGKLISIDVMAV